MKKSLHVESPLIESVPLSNQLGKKVFLKIESFQPSGSFKIRGIGLFCQKAAEKGAKHFVISSGGNAGLAVAYSGKCLNIPVTVIIPETTPSFMRDKIALQGAEVIVQGADFQESDKLAHERAKTPGTIYVSPFNDPLIWQGHSTLVHEVNKQQVKPDVVLVSVGGGGLMCGILQGMHELGWKDVPVMTLETEGAASFAKSVEAGHVVTLDRIQTIATSLGARRVADEAFAWTKRHKIIPKVVSDVDALESTKRFLDDHRLLLEPACSVALVPVYKHFAELQEFSSVLVVVCGGNVISLEVLERWRKQFGV